MRKLTLILISIAVLAVGGGLAFHALRESPEWTTSSPAALEAFEQGLSAEKKLYFNEALEHFSRALELDPDFTLARLKALSLSPRTPDRPKRIRQMIMEADLDRLNRRERFLLQHRLALIDKDRERADRLIDEYLDAEPNDLHALAWRCDRAWTAERLDEAERCYTHLLDIDPNWVFAQNHLGYIKMAKGDFAGAEAAFGAYGRIAPDQANPHDSLGELLMLRGQYPEAGREFERAVSIRSDFCASWSHMIDLAILQGRLVDAERLLVRAEQAVCPPEFGAMQKRRIAVWRGLEAGSPQLAVELAAAETFHLNMDALTIVVLYDASLAAGSERLSDAIEKEIGEWARNYKMASAPNAILAHIEARELAHKGQLAEAIARYRASDERISYSGDGLGIFKLYTRLMLASLLEQSGATAEAGQLRSEVRAVNPHLATRFATPPAWQI